VSGRRGCFTSRTPAGHPGHPEPVCHVNRRRFLLRYQARPKLQAWDRSRRCSGPGVGTVGTVSGRGAPARSQAAAAASRRPVARRWPRLSMSSRSPRGRRGPRRPAPSSRRRAGPRGCRSAGCRAPSGRPPPAHGEQLERLVGVQRGVAERCPAVLVVVTNRVEGGVAVVATTEQVRRVVAVGSETSAARASE
jgi:hypothetical protein